MEKIFAALGGSAKVVNLIVKLIIIAIIVFAAYKLYKKWKLRNVGKAFVDTEALDPNKNYDNIAKAINDAFGNWVNDATAMNDAAQQVNALSNNEIKHLNNRYVYLYKKTLQDAITSYWVCFPCADLKALENRLKAIGLN